MVQLFFHNVKLSILKFFLACGIDAACYVFAGNMKRSVHLKLRSFVTSLIIPIAGKRSVKGSSNPVNCFGNSIVLAVYFVFSFCSGKLTSQCLWHFR